MKGEVQKGLDAFIMQVEVNDLQKTEITNIKKTIQDGKTICDPLAKVLKYRW